MSAFLYRFKKTAELISASQPLGDGEAYMFIKHQWFYILDVQDSNRHAPSMKNELIKLEIHF